MHIPKPIVALVLLALASIAVAFRPQDKPTVDYGAGSGWAGPHPSQLVHLYREFPQSGQQEIVNWFQRVPGNGVVIQRAYAEGAGDGAVEILENGTLVSRTYATNYDLQIPVRGGTRLDFRIKAGGNPPNPGRLLIHGYVW